LRERAASGLTSAQPTALHPSSPTATQNPTLQHRYRSAPNIIATLIEDDACRWNLSALQLGPAPLDLHSPFFGASAGCSLALTYTGVKVMRLLDGFADEYAQDIQPPGIYLPISRPLPVWEVPSISSLACNSSGPDGRPSSSWIASSRTPKMSAVSVYCLCDARYACV
jgi:hypothetical protein